MVSNAPRAIDLFAYRVGFGDCFLLRFDYGRAKRHVLIDFGSRKYAKGGPHRKAVAEDIVARCKGKLDAVVATHRHGDHVNGFATKRGGKGTGDLIRTLNPKLVVQPWTEHPDAALGATAPPKARDRARAFRDGLHALDADGLDAFADFKGLRTAVGSRMDELLPYIGDDSVKQKSAVDNLMTMAENKYVYFGSDSGLDKLLPGVRVRVLGPPTLEQHDEIRREVDTHPEFWQLLSNTRPKPSQAVAGILAGAKWALPEDCPPSERTFVRRLQDERFRQLRSIVTALDSAMNNTSVILLFEVGSHRLLFSGDAQVESWQYAMSKQWVCKELAKASLYKVGHHGSRNATPRTLWGLFKKRGRKRKGRLVTVLSTEPKFHGEAKRHTEVPRSTLVGALQKESDLYNTAGRDAGGMLMQISLRP